MYFGYSLGNEVFPLYLFERCPFGLTFLFYACICIAFFSVTSVKNGIFSDIGVVHCAVETRLDVYIYDYLVKRNLQATAKAFQAEAKVSSDPVAIDAPGGFLFEWWSVFWDIFIARTNEKHSDAAASYIELGVCLKAAATKANAFQCNRNKSKRSFCNEFTYLICSDKVIEKDLTVYISLELDKLTYDYICLYSLMRQNPGTANALATKMYEERLKLPLQRDSLDEATVKRFGDNVGQVMDPNHASILKSAAASAQPSGHVLHGSAGGLSGPLQQVQTRNQQVPGSSQEIKSEIIPILNPRVAGPDASLIGVPGPNQVGNNLTLKGWPLTGLDQLRSGLLQQQKSFVQSSPQSLQQLQFLSPHQQQLLLQAQQNMNSPTAADIDNRRLRMLLNSRNMVPGKDGQSNVLNDVIPNVGSPMQSPSPLMPRTDSDLLMKTSNNQNGRKRKQAVSSSGPANSSGTANTTGPSPSSAPSTPSTHTPGDVMSMAQLQHNGGSSKPLMMFGDGTGPLTSPTNQLADMDRFVEDASLDDNVESFLSHDDMDPRDVGRSMDSAKGFPFTEIVAARASSNKVVCCHFSSDGKLLATGGHDKKAVLWHADSLKLKSSLEEHSLLITDVRFSSSLPRLATSSFDKTVRVWDADNPGYSLRTFTGHSASVMSLDFHPSKEDLICSCDSDGEMRFWSINNGNCARVFKGGTTQMRFQPRQGRYLAVAAESTICVLDVETQVNMAYQHRVPLQGHTKHVDSICWNSSGDLLASVSEDSVRVWSFGLGSEGECVHELSCNGSKFHSCVFHPNYPKSLEFWDMEKNKTMTRTAHEGLIAALAASNVTGVIASASHDKFVKLWK
ncbi:hypothetical protein ZIOFF_032942 [Zingiber officinale]|uniref:Transcriptional corepressor LEUNIG n=1 Tax=Zingiber officinale TaxID=94328 RepID=A0A8J5LBN6_ZINOF|nr:hypothetical protein ZIOFF_032942 [Zingiber officinale]